MKIHQVCHKWQGKSTSLLKLDEPQNLLTITYINHRNISIIWHRRCFQRVIFSCQEQESLYTSFGITPYFDRYHIKAFQWKKKRGGECFCSLKLKYLQPKQRTLLPTPRWHEQGRAAHQHLGVPHVCRQWGMTVNTHVLFTRRHFDPGSSTRLWMLILNDLQHYWNKRNKAEGLLHFVSRTIHVAIQCIVS